MDFTQFCDYALDKASSRPKVLFGTILMEALEECSFLTGLPDISKENNPSSQAVYNWFAEVARLWSRQG